MYFTAEQIQQMCGFLLCNDSNTFIYYCAKCRCEFSAGSELEEHIVFDHHDEKKNVDGIFVDDGIFLDTTAIQTQTIAIVPYVPPLVEIENVSQPNSITSTVSAPEQMVNTATNLIVIEDTVTEAEQNQHESLSNIDEQIVQDVPHGTAFPDEPSQNIDSSNSSSNCAKPTDMQVKNKSKCHRKPSIRNSTVRSKRNGEKSQTNIVYCDMCPEITFKTLDILRAHMKRHAMNASQKSCPICLIRPRNYDKHMRYVHNEAKPYKCDFCVATFKNNMGRVVHMRTHTGERPYLCAICGKSFKSQDTRKKHNIQMHTEQMPHPCTECDRQFISPSQLQEHIFSFHSTVRTYTCEICGHCYATRKYLRRHRQSHGEKIHTCDYCGKKFKTTETRRWHLRTVHKVMR